MIQSRDEYETTRRYIDRLQQILLNLQATHAPDQYEAMSKGFLKELSKAQRDISMYLSVSHPAEQKAA